MNREPIVEGTAQRWTSIDKKQPPAETWKHTTQLNNNWTSA